MNHFLLAPYDFVFKMFYVTVIYMFTPLTNQGFSTGFIYLFLFATTISISFILDKHMNNEHMHTLILSVINSTKNSLS